MEELMKLEKLVDNDWEDTEMDTLVEGDIFRMFNPNDGEIFADEYGETEFYVLGDPYMHPEHNVLTVNTVPRNEADAWGEEDENI